MDKVRIAESTSLLLRFPLAKTDREHYRWDCFWLQEPFVVKLSTGEYLTVPKGYVTDGASVPRWLQGIFPAIGDHLAPDLVHDYLYSSNLVDRKTADREFLYQMTRVRPYRKSWLDNHLRYWAVRVFGRWHYHKIN